MAKFRDNVEVGQGGEFLRLKDKESAYVIFMGDPYEFFAVWAAGKSTVVPEGTPKAKFRFRINAVVKEKDGNFVPKIFEQGPTVYNMLKMINDECNGLEETIVKITRKGSTMNDTEYQLMPLKQDVNPQTKAILAKLQLQNLEHEQKPQEDANGFDNDFGPVPHDMDQQSEELPF